MSVEIFMRSNFMQHLSIIYATIQTAQKVIRSSRISDHWKEKAIPLYAITMLINSMKLLITLASILTVFIILTLFSGSLEYLALSMLGVIEAIIIASLYILVRRHFL